MLLLSVVCLLVLVGILLVRRVNLTLGSCVFLAAWLLLGIVEPRLYSLWLVIPVIAILLVLNLGFLRRTLITKPVYGVLQKSMPPMSVTEAEALEAGTTWWEKEI